MNLSNNPISTETIEVGDEKYEVKIYSSPKTGSSTCLYFSISDKNKNFGFNIGISETLICTWKLNNKPNELENVLKRLGLEKIKIEIANGNKKDGFNFIFDSYQVESTPEETIKNLIEMNFRKTDEGIRREILLIAYKKWQKNPQNFVSKEELKKALSNISDSAIDRNIEYLKQKGYLLETKNPDKRRYWIKISSNGVDMITNPKKFKKSLSQILQQNVVNISGNVGINVVGNNNIIKGNNIEFVFYKIQKEVKKSNILNKEEIIKEIKNLKEEIIKDKPSTKKTQNILNKIKNYASFIHKKIIKHPVISQLIAEILIKSH